MSTSKNGPVLASLDIGSSLVKLVYSVISTPSRHDLHSMKQENQIDVVGVGLAPNTGTKHGVVVNIEATTESIKKAKEVKAYKEWVTKLLKDAEIFRNESLFTTFS